MKKKILLILLLVVPFIAGYAANIKGRSRSSMTESVNVQPKKAKPIKPVNRADTVASVAQDEEDDDKPVVKVQKKAEFPGGREALREYLRGTLIYPSQAAEAGIQGTVMVQFIVRRDGSLDNVEVLRSVDPILDAEAVRVVKSMPNWTPAQLNGRDVSSIFRLPFLFKLPAAESNTKGTNPTPAE